MNVRFQKTPKGEMATLPRKEYEALVAKAAEADEDAGTVRLITRARKEIAAGAPSCRRRLQTVWQTGKMRFVFYVNGVM